MLGGLRRFGRGELGMAFVPVARTAHGLAIGISLAAGLIPDLAHRGIGFGTFVRRIGYVAAALVVADLVRRPVFQ